jgi:hypothetical protein
MRPTTTKKMSGFVRRLAATLSPVLIKSRHILTPRRVTGGPLHHSRRGPLRSENIFTIPFANLTSASLCGTIRECSTCDTSKKKGGICRPKRMTLSSRKDSVPTFLFLPRGKDALIFWTRRGCGLVGNGDTFGGSATGLPSLGCSGCGARYYTRHSECATGFGLTERGK